MHRVFSLLDDQFAAVQAVSGSNGNKLNKLNKLNMMNMSSGVGINRIMPNVKGGGSVRVLYQT